MSDMSRSRSYQDLGPGQQLHRVIESCNDPETLYAKIESGHWDWLGVQLKGNRKVFLLGRPRRGGLGLVASGLSKHTGDGRHRVSIRVPHPVKLAPTKAWWPTPEAARADFERQKAVLAAGEGSGLYKLSLYIDGSLVVEEFVVRALPNRL